ncbi:MAG TPA: hypothetical protein VJY35_02670 [Candidatus Eisenbacteria bacterium]|nr:hypothetical protein [Candidatus Eisenbacteria bacterium]
MFRSAPVVLALAALLLTTSVASAAVPSPQNSTVESCLRVCPAGDIHIRIIVRDLANNPVAGSSVLLDFCSCPFIALCPLQGGEPYQIVTSCQVSMLTDAAGVAEFPLRAGGVCIGSVVVYADGVNLAQRGFVASPDQNGNMTVNASDQALLGLKIGGPYDPTGDLNCSGALEAGDQGVLAGHLGHSCAVVVPTLPKSWGTVKTIYR